MPVTVGARLLFSPSNTGPLRTANQVVTIHDMATFDCPEVFSRPFAAWYRYLLPRIAKRARHILTVSEFVKDRIVTHTGVEASKITVIPNGVNERFCPKAVADLTFAMTSLHLPSSTYILVVGSLEPRKNLGRLLQAWAQVQGRLPKEVWLVIVGAAGDSRVFAGVEFWKLPPRVFLTGPVNDSLLPSLYAGALASAYVSIYEGFGLPVLEAMASGTPVLASSHSSLSEVVGQAGLIVNPLNIEEIAEGIVCLVQDQAMRENLRNAGLLRASQYSWGKTARKTWDVLQRVACAN